MRYLTTLLLSLALLVPLSPEVAAQSADDRTAIEAELREIAASPDAEDLDRREVRSFLERDRVREVAGDLGIDLDAVERRVDALDGEEVAGLAERIRDAGQEQPLAGGALTLTSTTIIVVLALVIVLVIVA